MKIILLMLSLVCAVPLCAKEIKVGTQWPYLKAANGKVFVDVKFTFVSPREVRFMHTNGIGSLPLTEVVMPDDVTISATPPSTTLGPLGAMMSPEERKLMGIDKLNNDEQEVMVAWLTKAVNQAVQEERQKVTGFNGIAAAANPAVPALPGSSAVPPAPPEVAAPTPPPPAPTVVMTPRAGASRTMSSSSAAPLLPPAPPVTPGVTSSSAVPPAGDSPGAQVASQPPATAPDDTVVPASLKPAALGMPTAKRVVAGTGIVESQIEGEFKGFNTGKEYKLANGQVWRQHEVYASSHSAYEPGVMIYPANGGWMMQVDGADKAVRVTPHP